MSENEDLFLAGSGREAQGLRCSSLLPERNREDSRDRGARRPIENRASRAA